jgi:CubicO group peptidase (beta-lactamase class C family)
MKNRLILIFILFQFFHVYGQNKAEKIDRLITAYYQNGVFNGVVLVSQKNKIIYKKAFGIADREWDIPVTIDSKFKIASLSKSFTAMLILQLIDKGRIRLDGSIKEYCPDYQGMLGDSITIHQLLTHTSGIRSNLDPEEEAIQERIPHSLREMVKYAESADLLFKPGSGFSYSNLGYNILAYIIEQVSGKSYEIALKENILDPAGMNNTSQFNNDRIEKKLVRGYEYKLLYGYENAVMFDHSYTVGPGGMISTAEDLYRWDQALYSDVLLRGDLKVKMFTPHSSVKSGYGWFINKRKFPGSGDSVVIADHSGSINGFGAYMARLLSDSSFVVVLKNQRSDTYIDPAFAPDIGQQIISILYGEDVNLPKRSIARHIASLIGNKGVDSAIAEYYGIIKSDPGNYLTDEPELNKLGIELYFKFKMTNEALKIFEVNMLQFPRSYNTYDSYAYVLMQKGDYQNSIKYYNTGLEMLQKYPETNDLNAVKKDSEQALIYIKEMEGKVNK